MGGKNYDTGLITMKMRVWREKPFNTHHRGTCNQLPCDGMPLNANQMFSWNPNITTYESK